MGEPTGIPLPALYVQPPQQQPGPLDMYLHVQQIRSLLQGQQLDQAELERRQLQNQSMNVELAGKRQAIAAQHDPAWDASDPDKAVQILKKYSVPDDARNSVIEGITKLKTLLANSSKEGLAFTQQMHSYLDDQFQAARNAPADRQQSVYEAAKQNAIQYAHSLPTEIRPLALQEIAKAPAAYDPDWLDTEHALLRTTQDLNEAALKKAQTAEAGEKANQAKQEAGLAQAKTPGAQAESTVQQQQAALGPQERALAGNLFYRAAGGNPQAKTALNLETQQKVAAAQAGVAGGNSALRGVPPHLVAAATSEATKVGQEFADATAAANDMQTFVNLAKAGNKIAYAYSPTEGVLTLNTARGVKRVNMAEIESYAGAGSRLDRVQAFFGKNISGASIPTNVLDDMATLHQSIAANAQRTYANKLKVINQNYGSAFEPVNMGGSTGGQITVTDPTGGIHTFPDQASADRFKKLAGIK